MGLEGKADVPMLYLFTISNTIFISNLQSRLQFSFWSFHVGSGQITAAGVWAVNDDTCHGFHWPVLGGKNILLGHTF